MVTKFRVDATSVNSKFQRESKLDLPNVARSEFAPQYFSAFHPPSLLSMPNYNQGGQLDRHHAYLRAKMFEEKNETEEATKSQLVGTKKGRVTKEATKKTKKGDKKIRLEMANQRKKKKNLWVLRVIDF